MMLKTRLIPCLLVDKNLHLVKTTSFSKRQYIGDPLNAAYVFSNYGADEILLLDIDASPEDRTIPLEFVSELAHFTRVPLAVGGGIRSLSDIQRLIEQGVERVVLGSILRDGDDFLRRSVKQYGASTISVVINAFRTTTGELYGFYGVNGESNAGSLIELARSCEAAGAGEILVYDVNREGTMRGFDIDMYSRLNDALSVPLVALGGCGCEKDIDDLRTATPVSGVAAGSLFLFAPNTREVLLNYRRDRLIHEAF